VLRLLCFTAALAPGTAAASPGEHSPVGAARALEAAEAALNGPATLSAGATSAAPDATYALRNLAVALPALDGVDRRRAEQILARPTDKDDVQYFGKEAADSPICNPDFCVHWTETEKNAPMNDAFIDQVAAAADRSFFVENEVLAWQRPKGDGSRGARNGVGGEGQTDVYITDLGRGLYGFAAPDPGQRGPSRFAYLVLDNNYIGFPSPPLESMQVTVAHEYNHILQFGYDIFEDLWMFESTATWVEQYVFPDVDDYLNYLPAFASTPETPLTGEGIEIYAEAVWNHWLSSRYKPDVVRQAWAGSRSAEPPSFAPAAYDSAIRLKGGRSFSQEFGEFAAATAEWRSFPLVFPDAAAYPDMKRKGKLGSKTTTLKLDNTSYRLLTVKPHGSRATLKVKAPQGIHSTIALVGRVGPAEGGAVTVRSRYLAGGGRGTVQLDRLASFDRVTALVINGDARRGNQGFKSDASKYRASLKG